MQNELFGSDRSSDLLVYAAKQQSCTLCHLAEYREKVVYGEGPFRPPLMIIGEAPGPHEDAQGIPFVGLTKPLLERMLGAMGLSRSEVYLTNMVCCRPVNNRPPNVEEMIACRPRLKQQIAAVQPKTILALGKNAGNFLVRGNQTLDSLRSEWHLWESISLRVSYPLTTILRRPDLKRKMWKDLKELMSRF